MDDISGQARVDSVDDVHILTLAAPVFATNCYVVSRDGTGPCVVVDPGGGVAKPLQDELAARGLVPELIVATHGHVDHTWSAAALSTVYDVPLRLHLSDAYRLADPFGTLEDAGNGGGLRAALASGPLGQALAAAGCAPSNYEKPARVETFDRDNQTWLVAGLEITALHAPGHTEGSTLYLFDGAPSADSVLPHFGNKLAANATSVALTGDVLFAGTIGRTDLPGGDSQVMAQTLADVVRGLDSETLVLPGHGPASRMDRELLSNPYLARR